MAGNLVKWWKHKILGGYKQFSVLECNTDSEELVQNHQVRASSSCSAPPDLLIVSDRENSISYRSSGIHNLSHEHHKGSHNAGNNGSSSRGGGGADYIEIVNSKDSSQTTTLTNSNNFKYNKLKTKHLINKTNELLLNLEATEDFKELPTKVRCSTPNEKHQLGVYNGKEQAKDEKLHFEEFTCDVSVEGGKSSKPLQFSFTFYDLDGHHGKITKDDIVGIVYTIYESIGKSVVVPHCGSKTINVRLTFSPESKSKNRSTNQANHLNNNNISNTTTLINKSKDHNHSHGQGHGHSHGHNGRRQHRYRPRKLIASDEEENEKEDADADADDDDDDVEANVGEEDEVFSDKEKENVTTTYASRRTKSSNVSKTKSSSKASKNSFQTTGAGNPSSITENYYDSLPLENLNKCCAKQSPSATTNLLDNCIKCKTTTNFKEIELDLKPNGTKVKVLRKTRKTKQYNLDSAAYSQTRQRSLSVGNEVAMRNRHLMHTGQTSGFQNPSLMANKMSQVCEKTEEYLDGVQLRNPQRKAGGAAADYQHQRSQMKRNTTECWKTGFNRNDLISIIRESMEKNRLCFQLNEKPQANVTPIRQPQKRSSLPAQSSKIKNYGVSKIPTLIAHHNLAMTNSSFLNSKTSLDHHQLHHDNQSTNGSLYNHLQPHIPIYHQQMAINPAVLAAQNNIIGHSKINPCGYDSFLHATICAGNNNHHHNQFINNNNINNNNHMSSTPPPLPITSHVSAAACPLKPNQTQAVVPHLPHSLVKNMKSFQANAQKQKSSNQQQPVATVQPIISVPNTITTTTNANANANANAATTTNINHINTINLNTTTNCNESTKILNPTSHQIKLSKILRSGSYTQNYHQLQQQQQQQQQQKHEKQTNKHPLNSSSLTSKPNSPQYRGYQRLQSQSQSQSQSQAKSLSQSHSQYTKKHKLGSSNSEKLQHLPQYHHQYQENAEQRSKSSSKVKSLKTYENLVYAKLREDLQESGLKITSSSAAVNAAHSSAMRLSSKKEKDKDNKDLNEKYRKSRTDRKAAACLLQLKIQNPNSPLKQVSNTEKVSDYLAMLNMNCGDALECENLLGQTTDEETMSELNTPMEEMEAGKLSILESEETLPTPTTTTATISTTLTTNTSEALIDLNDDEDEDDVEEEEEDDDDEDEEEVVDPEEALQLDLLQLETPEDLTLANIEQHLQQQQQHPSSTTTATAPSAMATNPYEEDENELDLENDNEEEDDLEEDEEDVDDDDDEEDEDEEDVVDDEDEQTEIAALNSNSHMSPSSSKAALIKATANTTNTSTNININNNNNMNNLNNNSNNLNNTSSTTSTSSLIHRCVHEHIHHHYHHFEKKDE